MYLVTMNRYGDPDLGSYVIGVFETKAAAEFIGYCHECWRGGKYDKEVSETQVEPVVVRPIQSVVADEKARDFVFEQCGGFQYLCHMGFKK